MTKADFSAFFLNFSFPCLLGKEKEKEGFFNLPGYGIMGSDTESRNTMMGEISVLWTTERI